MWGTISRLFATKPRSSVRTPEPGEEAVAAEEEEGNYYNNSDPACKNLNDVPQAELAVHVFESMDRNMGDDRRPKGGPGDQHGVTDNENFSDAYDKRQVSDYLNNTFAWLGSLPEREGEIEIKDTLTANYNKILCTAQCLILVRFKKVQGQIP